MHGRRLIETMPLEVDNSFGTLLEMHPAIASHPISSSTIMADILAYIQIGYASDLSGDRHVEKSSSIQVKNKVYLLWQG
jgi:hypothetical protein